MKLFITAKEVKDSWIAVQVWLPEIGEGLAEILDKVYQNDEAAMVSDLIDGYDLRVRAETGKTSKPKEPTAAQLMAEAGKLVASNPSLSTAVVMQQALQNLQAMPKLSGVEIPADKAAELCGMYRKAKLALRKQDPALYAEAYNQNETHSLMLRK
jgi:hypothetical protein